MAIPKLSTAFCGSSLQTGTKIIAWIEIVLHVLAAIGLVAFIVLASSAISDIEKKNKDGFFNSGRDMDDKFWEEKRTQYGLPEPFQPVVNHREITLDGNHLNNLNFQKSNEMEVFKSAALGFGVAIVCVMLVFLLISFIATIFLLLGAQKKKPGYLVFWMVISVLSLIGSLLSMFQRGFIFNAVFFVINLYFTWVVYSFYRQLKTDSNPSTQRAAGEVKMHGDDVPHAHAHFTPGAPPAYAYNQKEY